MMGERTVAQEALFYSFRLERHVPPDRLLRSIDRFVDLSDRRTNGSPVPPVLPVLKLEFSLTLVQHFVSKWTLKSIMAALRLSK
jgi:hypothetical protein